MDVTGNRRICVKNAFALSTMTCSTWGWCYDNGETSIMLNYKERNDIIWYMAGDFGLSKRFGQEWKIRLNLVCSIKQVDCSIYVICVCLTNITPT